MTIGIPSDLFTLLAQSKSQPSRTLQTAQAAANAMNAVTQGLRDQRERDRTQKLEDFFDTSIPDQVTKRILPGVDTAKNPVSFRDLKELSSSGVASLLKDPNSNVDVKTLSILGSNGDPDKASKLYQMFSQPAPDGTPASSTMTMNPMTVAAIKAIRPPKVAAARGTGTSDPEVNTLKALQQTYSKQLGGDLSERDRQTAQANLDAVNRRLAKKGGVELVAPAPAASTPTPAAAAPVPAAGKSTSSLVQQLLSALTQ